jgi:ribonuclease-3
LNENRGIVDQHNERLEFLGDTVLGLIVSEYLYQKLPYTPEGELSHLRSRLVDASACAGYVQELGIGDYVLLGRGEKQNDGRGRESIRADLLEALIGAIYLDGGIEEAKELVTKRLIDSIEETLATPDTNWKAKLQDWCQKRYHEPPNYELIQEIGPDHEKIFEVSVMVRGEVLGSGQGASKKEAQQEAAKQALERIDGEG